VFDDGFIFTGTEYRKCGIRNYDVSSDPMVEYREKNTRLLDSFLLKRGESTVFPINVSCLRDPHEEIRLRRVDPAQVETLMESMTKYGLDNRYPISVYLFESEAMTESGEPVQAPLSQNGKPVGDILNRPLQWHVFRGSHRHTALTRLMEKYGDSCDTYDSFVAHYYFFPRHVKKSDVVSALIVGGGLDNMVSSVQKETSWADKFLCFRRQWMYACTLLDKAATSGPTTYNALKHDVLMRMMAATGAKSLNSMDPAFQLIRREPKAWALIEQLVSGQATKLEPVKGSKGKSFVSKPVLPIPNSHSYLANLAHLHHEDEIRILNAAIKGVYPTWQAFVNECRNTKAEYKICDFIGKLLNIREYQTVREFFSPLRNKAWLNPWIRTITQQKGKMEVPENLKNYILDWIANHQSGAHLVIYSSSTKTFSQVQCQLFHFVCTDFLFFCSLCF